MSDDGPTLRAVWRFLWLHRYPRVPENESQSSYIERMENAFSLEVQGRSPAECAELRGSLIRLKARVLLNIYHRVSNNPHIGDATEQGDVARENARLSYQRATFRMTRSERLVYQNLLEAWESLF